MLFSVSAMNMSPMPIAASNTSASRATNMAMPFSSLLVFSLFSVITTPLVIRQTRHTGHGDLNALVGVCIPHQPLCSKRNPHVLDVLQKLICGIREGGIVKYLAGADVQLRPVG